MELRCLWNLLTGTYCPGCGTLRAVKALWQFDIAAAFLYNPFLFLIIAPFSIYMGVIYLRRLITKERIPSALSSPKAAWAVMAVIACVWVLRNVFPPLSPPL